jgi:cytochrome c-type biogenesis protein CcmH
MTPRWTIRIAAFASAAAIALLTISGPRSAAGQQLGEGMDRTGTVGIQNETERQLFAALICMCGCPREALSTCTCGYAHDRRAELRQQLAQGRSIEDIKAAYAQQFGPQALAVPPNVGANRLLWAVPLLAIVIGGAFVITTLRRWRRRAAEGASTAGPDPGRGGAARDGSGGAKGPRKRKSEGKRDAAGDSADTPRRDAYDDKLDDELRDLDE